MLIDQGAFTPMPTETEWEWTSSIRDKPSVNGGMVTTFWKMRRKVDGQLQYRELTPEEEEYWVEKLAW